jgi:hypothetical protein
MLKSAYGTEYYDLKSLAIGELAAGRMTQADHDALVTGLDHISQMVAAGAFDWTQLLTVLGNIAPIIAMFIPGFQWVAALIPAIVQIVQLIQSGGSAQSLIAQLQALFAQIFGNLPKPTPTPIPGPSPGPNPGPLPIPG